MNKRPLSPHLQVYKVQITSFLSSMHRLTGVLLFFLLIAFSWYFVLHIQFPKLAINVLLLPTPVIKIAFLSFFVSLIYHFFVGIRHLLWDVGFSLEVATNASKRTMLLVVVVLVVMIFIFYYYLFLK